MSNKERCVSLLASVCVGGGIGANGTIPWSLPNDLKRFKRITSSNSFNSFEGEQLNEKLNHKNILIMGYRTFESINKKPLPNRVNIVVSSKLPPKDVSDELEFVCTLESAFKLIAYKFYNFNLNIFIIGGSRLYKESMEKELVDNIYITRINEKFDCDVFFPDIPLETYKLFSISKTFSQNNIPYDFLLYKKHTNKKHLVWDEIDCMEKPAEIILSNPFIEKRNHAEYQYLDLISDLIHNGIKQEDRTGVGSLSSFGKQLRFDLRESFPLLTTKRVFWRGVVEELLWFIRGETNANTLTDKGINIWKGNGSRNFLDMRGLTENKEGDLGPVYGFQWRHFGATYVGMDSNYSGIGIDQLMDIIKQLKTNPNDRRIILLSWNPLDIEKMALPPCHLLCQFYVGANNELSCQMYQRSCDIGLGVPFNIASYALLTCIIAKVVGFVPGDFVHTLGNAHIYLNHIEALKIQVERIPTPFPILKFKKDITNIEDIKFEDLELIGYYPHSKIQMEMAV